MTREEILDAVLPLNYPQNAPQRLQWLINLVLSPDYFRLLGVENNIEHSAAFNELQQRLYNRLRPYSPDFTCDDASTSRAARN